MTHGSLFSGIGGFDLASQWMGWDNIFHCEWNEFGQRVLKHHFPTSISYGDITTTDFTIHRGKIDILTGGFPCQDASVAKSHGQGQMGLRGSRTGLLFEMVRAIKEIQPRYVVAENVANLLKINGGKDFGTILTELSAMGYNAEWRICRAEEVGAPHKRARLYLVAYSDRIRLQANKTFIPYVRQKTSSFKWLFNGATVPIVRGGSWSRNIPIPCMDDGLPENLDGITFSKWRQESVKAYGNAVVPQLPYQIFQAIQQFEQCQAHPNP